MNIATTSAGLPPDAIATGVATPIVPAPASLQRFAARSSEGPGNWIDYAQHAAYQAGPATIADRVGALLEFARYFGVILCKRLISYELIATHLRNPGSLAAWLAFLRQAAVNVLRRIAPPAPPRSGAGDAVQAALRRDGVCVLKLAAQPFDRAAARAQPLFERLHSRRGVRAEGGRAFDESRSAARRTADAELYDAVEAMLQDCGVIDGVSSYLGRRAALVDVNPQINDASDDFWRHLFPDLPDADRPLKYCHRDASGGDIKAIVYMSDVDAGNGPFSYVTGSQGVHSGTLGDWIEETNDQSALSGTGPDARRRFAALPAALRRKCSCGNDILPGSEIAQRLLAAEWTITAARGHVVLFDTKGLHRGGLVEQGERRVLTCVLG